MVDWSRACSESTGERHGPTASRTNEEHACTKYGLKEKDANPLGRNALLAIEVTSGFRPHRLHKRILKSRGVHKAGMPSVVNFYVKSAKG